VIDSFNRASVILQSQRTQVSALLCQHIKTTSYVYMQLNNLLVVQLMAQLKCQIEKKNINLTLM